MESIKNTNTEWIAYRNSHNDAILNAVYEAQKIGASYSIKVMIQKEKELLKQFVMMKGLTETQADEYVNDFC